MSEMTALLWATGFSALKGVFDFIRHRQFNPVSIIVLLGIATSIVGFFLGRDSRLLLIRESFFTGLLGVSCFISLLFPRPLMFYFGRHFMAGNDLQKRKEFENQWEIPRVRFTHRLITVVWGTAFLTEFIIRVFLVYDFSTTWVLALSPFVTTGITLLTIVWTFRYIRKVRQRALQVS